MGKKRVIKVVYGTEQKNKFSIKDFFSNCDQTRSSLRIWLHLLKKSTMESFFFCTLRFFDQHGQLIHQYFKKEFLFKELSRKEKKNAFSIQSFIFLITFVLVSFISPWKSYFLLNSYYAFSSEVFLWSKAYITKFEVKTIKSRHCQRLQ